MRLSLDLIMLMASEFMYHHFNINIEIFSSQFGCLTQKAAGEARIESYSFIISALSDEKAKYRGFSFPKKIL